METRRISMHPLVTSAAIAFVPIDKASTLSPSFKVLLTNMICEITDLDQALRSFQQQLQLHSSQHLQPVVLKLSNLIDRTNESFDIAKKGPSREGTSTPMTSLVVKTRNVTEDIMFDKSVAKATSVEAITTAVALFSTICEKEL